MDRRRSSTWGVGGCLLGLGWFGCANPLPPLPEGSDGSGTGTTTGVSTEGDGTTEVDGTTEEATTTEEGTTTFFVRPMGDQVVTVLGEVPLATAQQIGRSVARR